MRRPISSMSEEEYQAATSAEEQPARELYDKLQDGMTLTKARAAYRDAFGVGVNDRSIDAEFGQLLARHCGGFIQTSYSGSLRQPIPYERGPNLAVPLRIALAYYLRPGGSQQRKGQRGRPPEREWKEWKDMQDFNALKAKHRAAGMSTRDADYEAAEEIEKRGRMTVEQILSWRDPRKKRARQPQ